jgi:acyl-CoA synthetase (AMP-forming)/AMP-acid ligase II
MEEVRAVVKSSHGLDSRILLVPPGTLPYTSSGKLSRAKMRQNYLAAALPTVAATAA